MMPFAGASGPNESVGSTDVNDVLQMLLLTGRQATYLSRTTLVCICFLAVQTVSQHKGAGFLQGY
jgi:hypothetical protein